MKKFPRYCPLILLLISIPGCTNSDSPIPDDLPVDVAPSPAIDQPLAQVNVLVDDPDSTNVVTLGMALEPAQAEPGEMVTLAVRMRIATDWHTYAMNQPTDIQIPTTLKLALPAGLEEVGDWDIPPAHPLDESTYAYENEVTFRRFVRVKEGASGSQEIRCEVGYQACTAESCLRPTSATIDATLEVAP